MERTLSVPKHDVRSTFRRTLLTFLSTLLLMGCVQPTLIPPITPPPPAAGPVASPLPRQPTPTPVPSRPFPLTLRPEEPPGEQAVALLPPARALLPALIALTQYTIGVNVEYARRSFQGHVRVDYTNTEQVPLDRLYFRLFPNGGGPYGNGSLSVSRVSVNGQRAQTALSLHDTVLEVRLRHTLAPGEQVQVALDFTGVISEDFGTPEATGYGIYKHTGSVITLAGWYPVLAVFDEEGWNLDPVFTVGDTVYSDAAFYTVDLTVPGDLVVAATGVEVRRNVLNGRTRYRFVSGPARDFTLVMSPDFQAVSRAVNGTRVNTYFLPGDEAGGRRALEVAERALQTFNARFGPYPYTELDLVEVPLQGAAGVEYPGLLLLADFLYDEPEDPFFVVATAHEVAHQWWYNVVGNDVIDEPWLDEALATYSSALYFEETWGEEAYSQIVAGWEETHANLIAQGKDDLVTRGLPHFEEGERADLYGAIVYLKGALFFHTLRQTMGDDAFFRALRQYYREHQFRVATATALLDTFQQVSDQDLSPLYRAWLYAKHVP